MESGAGQVNVLETGAGQVLAGEVSHPAILPGNSLIRRGECFTGIVLPSGERQCLELAPSARYLDVKINYGT